MATKECPACGNVVSGEHSFCPACGTKLIVKTESKKTVNKQFESDLFRVDSVAEVNLAKPFGAGIAGSVGTGTLNQLELQYLAIIEKYPSESRAYIAYVSYMIKYVQKVSDKLGYMWNLDLIVSRCRNYLKKAREYATDEELEEILQLDSSLTQKVEGLNVNEDMKSNYNKAKKRDKIAWIALGLLFGGLILAWLIIEMAGG